MLFRAQEANEKQAERVGKVPSPTRDCCSRWHRTDWAATAGRGGRCVGASGQSLAVAQHLPDRLPAQRGEQHPIVGPTCAMSRSYAARVLNMLFTVQMSICWGQGSRRGRQSGQPGLVGLVPLNAQLGWLSLAGQLAEAAAGQGASPRGRRQET